MKKLLTLALAIASLGAVGSWSTAKANTLGNPQIRIQIGQRRHWDRDRYDRDRRFNNRLETRIVHDGWRTYRETYQVRYLPDGRTQWVLVSRERVY